MARLNRLASKLVVLLSSSNSAIVLGAVQNLVLVIANSAPPPQTSSTPTSPDGPSSLLMNPGFSRAISPKSTTDYPGFQSANADNPVARLGFTALLPSDGVSRETSRTQLLQITNFICQLLESLLR